MRHKKEQLELMKLLLQHINGNDNAIIWSCKSQISDVQQKGSYLYVHGDGNLQEICFSISGDKKLIIFYI